MTDLEYEKKKLFYQKITVYCEIITGIITLILMLWGVDI